MITVTEEFDISKQESIYTVHVPKADLISIELDPLERAQLAEPAKSAADVLLDLHTLAYRQLQQSGAQS